MKITKMMGHTLMMEGIILTIRICLLVSGLFRVSCHNT